MLKLHDAKIIIIIIILNIFVCCKNETVNDKNTLTFVESIYLKLNEPSGLTYNNEKNSLYVVTDNPKSKIYTIDFAGKVLDSLNFRGDDLEAITYNIGDSTLWVSEETLMQLVHLDTEGNELNRFDIDFLPYNFYDLRIEGLCINTANNYLVLLNEKNPGAVIELDLNDLNVKNIYYLDFASDYSAIDYIEDKECYIILSDEDKKLFFWNTNNEINYEYDLGYSKAEGIVKYLDLLFITTENGNRLFKYAIQ